MADRDVVTRTGVGAALSASDYDQNVNSMSGTVEEITAATHTIAVTDQNKTIQYNRGTAIAVGIPTAATIKAAMDTSVDNFKILLKNIGAGVVTVTSTDNIDGALTLALNQWDSVVLQTNTANDSWQIVSRDMDVVDINGGTVDGAVIGGASAAAITGTTIKADTSLELATGETVTGIEKVSTNSDTQLITSSGMETYADAAAAAEAATVPQWSDLATFNTLVGTVLGTNTAIPATATKLELVFFYVSNQVPSGNWEILLGTGAGTFTASVDGSCNGTQMAGTQYDCAIAAANGSTFHGSVMFTKVSGNTWSGIGQIAEDGTGTDYQSGGTVTLGATLTSVRVQTTSNGFDGSSAVYVKVYS